MNKKRKLIAIKGKDENGKNTEKTSLCMDR